MDLSDHPIADGSADGSDVHLQEEVAESVIGWRALELKPKGLFRHNVMPLGKRPIYRLLLYLLRIPNTAHHQEVPGVNANTVTHPGIRDCFSWLIRSRLVA